MKHDLKYKFRLIGAAAVLAAFGGNAKAAVISKTYEFTASSFSPLVNPSSVSPFPTIAGKFTLTYDRLISIPEGLSGIVLHSLDAPLGSPVAFRYDYISALDIGVVQVGGSQNGIAGGGGTSDDFFLSFQFTGNDPPHFGGFNYSNGSVVPNETFIAGVGSVTEIAGVPEPSTWLLIIGGFGLVGSMLRRRRALATA